MKYLVACSGGNDSVALIQWMHENHDSNEWCVLYNNTGWAREDWPERMASIEQKLVSIGVSYIETKSEGLIGLVKRKKGWPMPASNMQFCTQELKEIPTLKWFVDADRECELTIVTGRRREESQNRANLPIWEYDTEKYQGRDIWNPICSMMEPERDSYIRRFGFAVLPHSSMECYPCVCANKTDLAQIPLDDKRIDLIETVEIEMGFTSNKKPRTMFRPYRVGGGVGIREAIKWGHGKTGWKAEGTPEEYQFKEDDQATENQQDWVYESIEHSRQCDGGLCGD